MLRTPKYSSYIKDMGLLAKELKIAAEGLGMRLKLEFVPTAAKQ